jgi:hypothetical protein
MFRTVMAAMFAVGAFTSPVQGPARAAGQASPPRGGTQPGPGPALGVFPPNATRVVARVVAQKTYKADSLVGEPPVGAPGTTVDAVTLAIEQASQAQPEVPVGPAVGTIEAFSRAPLPRGLVGRHVEAIVTLAGNTLASRWFVSEIRPLPHP